MKQILSIAVLSLVLGGCSTPQVALDEANHGVKLISELEKSLTEFRRIQSHSVKTKAASIREQKDALSLVEKTGKRDMRARVAVGDKVTGKTLESLLTSTDILAIEDAAYAATIAENEARVNALLSPIPSTKDSTSAAQTALAELGKELSRDIRRGELLAFFKSVKASVEEAKEKISKADATKSEPDEKKEGK